LLGEGVESKGLRASGVPITLGSFYPDTLLLSANYIHLTSHLKNTLTSMMRSFSHSLSFQAELLIQHENKNPQRGRVVLIYFLWFSSQDWKQNNG